MQKASIWLRLRAWWYMRGKEKKNMPRDVREYLIRLYMKAAPNKTSKERDEYISMLIKGAFHLERDQISDDLRDELLKTAYDLLGPAPPIPLPPKVG
jgi:hypothetical protein